MVGRFLPWSSSEHLLLGHPNTRLCPECCCPGSRRFGTAGQDTQLLHGLSYLGNRAEGQRQQECPQHGAAVLVDSESPFPGPAAPGRVITGIHMSQLHFISSLFFTDHLRAFTSKCGQRGQCYHGESAQGGAATSTSIRKDPQEPIHGLQVSTVLPED